MALFAVPNLAHANDFEVYVKAQGIYDSEPFYVASVLNGHLDSPFFGGDSATALNEEEYGLRFRRLSLAWVRKSHTWLRFHPQTAELLHSVNNRLPLTEGKEYEIQINAKKYAFHGVRSAYQFASSPIFGLLIGGTYIVGENLLEGTTQGTAKVTAPNQYDFSGILLDYYYRKDDLFDNEGPPPQGNGYAFDFELFWKPDPRLAFIMKASELFGRIYWRNAPFTVAQVDSDTKTFDEEGYVKFNPTLKGTQGARDFTQTLNSQLNSQTVLSVDQNTALLFELLVTPIKTYPWIGLRHTFGNNSSLDTNFNPQQKSLHLRWASRWLSVGISSDNLDLSRTRSFSLAVAVSAAPF